MNFLHPINSQREKRRVIQESNRIVKHNFCILSKKINFGDKINWHTNFEGLSWPKEPVVEFRKNNYNFSSKNYIGDIKLPWEFNKHLHFQELAKAYYLTKNDKYRQEFFKEITDWLYDNPYETGVNWSEGLIAAHRAISWIIALIVFKEKADYRLLKKIHQSLKYHSIFIEQNYEFGERASNHLLGELCAQIVIGAYLNTDSLIRQRAKKAAFLLEGELKKQIYSDGVDYEQSTSYQRVILEFLLFILLISKDNGKTLPLDIWRITEKMVDFMMHMTQPNGHLQPISDADSARVFILGNDINDFRPHLAIAAYLFNRGDFKFVAGDCYDAASWFLNDKKYQVIKAMMPKETAKSFPDGGYFVSRSDWSDTASWLFFDCGNIGMGKWPENTFPGLHGHSDTLNFGLALGRRVVFTDLGSYSYTTELDYHHYFRSAKGHNLPVVDGRDENILTNSPWILDPIANGENREIEISSDYDFFSGEHGGYTNLEDPVQAKREILHLKNQQAIIIKDTLIAQRRHQLEEKLHLFPGISVRKSDKDYLLVCDKNVLANLSFSDKPEIEVIKGSRTDPGGWYAPEFGRKEIAIELNIKKIISPNEKFYTLISWGKDKPDLHLIDEIGKKCSKKRTLVISKTFTESDLKIDNELLTSWYVRKNTLLNNDSQVINFYAQENFFAFMVRFFPRMIPFKHFFEKLADIIDWYRISVKMMRKGINYSPKKLIIKDGDSCLAGYLICRKLPEKPEVIIDFNEKNLTFLTRMMLKRLAKIINLG